MNFVKIFSFVCLVLDLVSLKVSGKSVHPKADSGRNYGGYRNDINPGPTNRSIGQRIKREADYDLNAAADLIGMAHEACLRTLRDYCEREYPVFKYILPNIIEPLELCEGISEMGANFLDVPEVKGYNDQLSQEHLPELHSTVTQLNHSITLLVNQGVAALHQNGCKYLSEDLNPCHMICDEQHEPLATLFCELYARTLPFTDNFLALTNSEHHGDQESESPTETLQPLTHLLHLQTVSLVYVNYAEKQLGIIIIAYQKLKQTS